MCSCYVRHAFEDESRLYSYLNVKELLARSRGKIWCLSDCNCTWNDNHLVRKRTLQHLARMAIWFSCVVTISLYGVFDCVFILCPAQFQNESTVYSFLNVKELLAQNRREILRLSDCNWTWTQNFLVRKETLDHLAKPENRFNSFLSTYLYGAFDPMIIWMYPLIMSCTIYTVNPHSIVARMSRNSFL